MTMFQREILVIYFHYLRFNATQKMSQVLDFYISSVHNHTDNVMSQVYKNL